jgi:hypothetical protein
MNLDFKEMQDALGASDAAVIEEEKLAEYLRCCPVSQLREHRRRFASDIEGLRTLQLLSTRFRESLAQTLHPAIPELEGVTAGQIDRVVGSYDETIDRLNGIIGVIDREMEARRMLEQIRVPNQPAGYGFESADVMEA